MADLDSLPLIQTIPSPDSVRARLAQLVREQDILRALLRVSEHKREAVERDRLQKGGPLRGA
jgi:hypothetical protein